MVISALLLTIALISFYFDEEMVGFLASLGLFIHVHYRINDLKKMVEALQAKANNQENPLAQQSSTPKEKTSPELKKEHSIADRIKADRLKKQQATKYFVTENNAQQPQKEKTPLKEKTTRIEEEISSKWMFWVGGVAFAFGGGFLVKYSIENNLISPAIRISIGFIIGIAMALGGEYIRQKRANFPKIADLPDYLPSAISAAGLMTAYAAIYSAYAIYDYISPLVTLAIMTALSFFATGLAFYQGRFFAYLGLIGGIILPMLISTGGGDAWKLFPYLLIVIAASLYAARQKEWIDVAATSLSLALIWPLLWMFNAWHLGDILPVGLYILIISGLNLYFLTGACKVRENDPTFKGLISRQLITWVSDVIMAGSVLLMVGIIRIDNYSTVSFMLLSLGLLALAASHYRASMRSKSGAFDMAALLSVAGLVFLFATWHTPELIPTMDLAAGFDDPWAATTSPGQDQFIFLSAVYSIVIFSAAFLGRNIFLRQNFWASLSSAVPLLMLVTAYIRVENFAPSIIFAGVALLLGVIYLAAIRKVMSEKSKLSTTALAAYAAACTTAIALSLAMVLENAWLTFAFALQIFALAHIWRFMKVDGLRVLAGIMGVIILIRLFLNPEIAHYQMDSLPLINWLFYGYALTAVLFFYAGRVFRTGGYEGKPLDSILRIGSIFLALTFVSLEIHVICSDANSLTSPLRNVEAALQTISWSLATAALYWYEVKHNDRLIGIIRRITSVITLAGLLFAGGIINNIYDNIYTMREVGGKGFVHFLLILQLLIPGLIYGFKAFIAYRAEKPRSFKIYGAVAFFGVWYWCSAEVVALNLSYTWELYGYSIAWLAYAVVLLFVGLRFNFHKIRLVGLFVLSVVVLKVFLWDMKSLEGLSRALSFMGLGATLIGLGALYQKIGRKKRPQDPAEPTDGLDEFTETEENFEPEEHSETEELGSEETPKPETP